MPRKRTAAEVLPSWKLTLLGTARLENGQQTQALERLSAALLAYLALEGPSPRSRLVGLLWPDRAEDAARANLRQRLKRLRDATNLISGEEILQLRPDLEVDAVRLESLAFTGEYTEALALEGEFLLGHDYADCDELQVWVEATRERLAAARSEALEAEAARLEREGDLTSASALAEQRIGLDPYHEDAHRRLMRLRYLAGDRAGALRAYARCRVVLGQELGVTPMPETLELAALIERGAVPTPQPPESPRPHLPTAILRPPVLVGREREWARLEAAWQAEQFIIISGEPGVGKTRLALDFATSRVPHEAVLHLQSRPGDSTVMYASFARNWRRMLEQFKPELEPWVRAELSRVLPELAETPDQQPEPIRSEAEKLRFYQSHLESLLACVRAGLRVFVSDDIQFADPASGEAALFLIGALTSASEKVGAIFAYRTDELNPEIGAVIEQSLNAGLAVQVRLEPLRADGVANLIHGLDLPGVDASALGAQLARYTGGNPVFVLETVKHLLETNTLQSGVPERLPPPESIRPLVRQRFDRLSKPALRLARVAGVAGTDFNLRLAAHVLGTDVLDLADETAQLEAAQVMTGNAFSHDLIFEATLEDVPRAVQAFLHGRIAEYLETAQAQPARIAYHWLEGGNEERAAPWLIRAGRLAEAAFRFPEAIQSLERAAHILRAARRDSEAFEALHAVSQMLLRDDIGSRLESVTQALLDLANTPLERALAHSSRAGWLHAWARYAEGEQVARAGLQHAVAAGSPERQAELASHIAEALWEQGNREAAASMLIEVCTFDEARGPSVELVESLNNVGFALATLSRYGEAQAYYERADEIALRVEAKVRRVGLLANLSFNQRVQGFAERALGTLETAHAVVRELSGTTDYLFRNLHMQGATLVTLESYTRALECLRESLEISRTHGLPHAFVLGDLARLHLRLGDFEACETHLIEAEAQPAIRDVTRIGLLRVRAELDHQRGIVPSGSLKAALRLLEKSASLDQRIRLELLGTDWLEPQATLEVCRAALEQARAFGLGGVQVDANARIAQAALKLGDASVALAHATDALALLETFTPDLLERADVLLTHHHALTANDDPKAHAALEHTLAWVLETASKRVPPKFRESFLTHNSINRAILDLARAAGLEGMP